MDELPRVDTSPGSEMKSLQIRQKRASHSRFACDSSRNRCEDEKNRGHYSGFDGGSSGEKK